jgi:hypothetical protein
LAGQPLVGPCLIVGEGEDEESFFLHLLQHRDIAGFDVRHTKGNTRIGEFLEGARILPGFDKVSGIIVVADNDDDPSSAFDNVKNQIVSVGSYAVPSQPLEIASGNGSPDLVIVMLPSSVSTGALETLCLPAAFHSSIALQQCVEEFAQCASIQSWPMSKQSKSKLRCVLSAACKSDPNTPLRYAWSRPESLIPLSHSSFDEIAQYLRDFRANYS